MDKGDQYVWKYLIENGGVVGSWCFYGANYDYDDKKTNDCEKAIEKYGIDWRKSKAPRTDHEAGFLGTFCEETEKISVLVGDLCVNGIVYRWGMELDEPKAIINFLSDLLPEYKG